MENSDLLQLLKKIDPKKYKKLIEFCRYKLPENSFKDIQLLCAILDASPQFEAVKLTKEYLFEKIYPHKLFYKSIIEKRMVVLKKVVECFLIVEHYTSEENAILRDIDLLKWLKLNDLQSLYLSKSRLVKMSIDKTEKKSHFSYFVNFLFQLETHEFLSLNNKSRGDLNLHELMSALNYFYYIHFLEFQNRLLIQDKLVSKGALQLEDIFLNKLNIDISFVEGSHILEIVVSIQELLRSKSLSSDDFYNIHNLISNYKNYIDDDLRQSFNTYVRNVCGFLPHRNGEIWNALFFLLKSGIENKEIYINGKLQTGAFYNVVNSGVRTGNFIWVKDFLLNNKDNIIGDNQERDYFRLNMSCFLFYTKKYDEALQYLPVIRLDQDLQYFYHSKRLEVMIYFEQKSPLLTYKIDAFKMLLSRTGAKMLSNNHKSLHVNFLNFLIQIYASIPGDKSRSEKLISRIENRPLVAEREWLLEKAREI